MKVVMSLARLSDRRNPKRAVSGVLLLIVLLSAGTPTLAVAEEAPAVAEEPSLEPPYELVINSVVDAAFDDLIFQIQRQPALRSMFAPVKKVAGASDDKEAAAPGRVTVMVDRTVDRKGLRSVAVELLDPLVIQIARQKLPEANVVDGTRPPSGPTSVKSVQYILDGRLSSLDAMLRTPDGTFRFDLLLTDTKTDYIVAQVSVRFTAKGVNLVPEFCCVSH
jgi:hypothetical protein